MADALIFPSNTNHFSLPLLFSGQAQKEFFINQALSTLDSLLQLAVDDTLADPPATPIDGECYRVAPEATGDWTGMDDKLALRIAGAWQFIMPRDGARIYNRASGHIMLFDAGWSAVSGPPSPSGGSMVDAEARAAIDGIIQALRNAGIFAA